MASQNKPVYFNIETEKELLDFADGVNFSNWVKGKIREDIQKIGKEVQIKKETEVKNIQPDDKKQLVWSL